jgi:hypothetical protein
MTNNRLASLRAKVSATSDQSDVTPEPATANVSLLYTLPTFLTHMALCDKGTARGNALYDTPSQGTEPARVTPDEQETGRGRRKRRSTERGVLFGM